MRQGAIGDAVRQRLEPLGVGALGGVAREQLVA
jgi:hypothetical protein